MHFPAKRVCAAWMAGLVGSLMLIPSFSVIAAEIKAEDRNGDGVIDVFDYLLAKRETVAQSNPVEIKLAGMEVAPGSTVPVQLSFGANPGCENLCFLLDYSEGCTLVSKPKIKSLLKPQSPYTEVDDETNVVLFISVENSLVTESGSFMELDIQIPADAAPGTEYSFAMRNVHAFGSDHEEMPVRFDFGKITVSPTAPLVTLPASDQPADRNPVVTTMPNEGEGGETTETTVSTFCMDGIDVSQWQAKIDFNAVRDAGTEFVILRAGYGKYASQVDSKFVVNYDNAKAAGLPVGAYWYSYAKNEDEARLEAAACMEVLGDRKFEFPIAYDFEEPFQMKYSKAKIESIICAFCDELEKNGYYCSIYSFASAFTYNFSQTVKDRFDAFVAHYGVSKPAYKGPYGVWQYSSTGRVDGISVNVDRDYAYRNYPYIIKSNHLNGF
ncbi:MAG: hypothetical protein IK130_12160 [Oscillospiraceae bacterium]|nr:hypothetical protein [Oscillospiraceae bacterium]